MLSERELAFIAIHEDSYPRVYRFVRRRVESPEMAEELAADVFRVVWQKWGDEPRAELSWLLTIARNLVGNAYRSRDRQQALQGKLRSAAVVRFGDDSDNVAVQDALAALRDLISAVDPAHNDRSVPDSGDALRRMLSEPAAFTDTIPPNVTSLPDRKQRRARLAGVLALAAAAVTAGVLVATNLGALTTGAVPANTGSGVGTGSSPATATPTPSASVTPSVSPTATPAATAPAVAAGPVACTKDTVEGVQSWLAEQLPSMQVSGCAGDWMALSMTAEGGQTDAGSWFWMAKLADRKYVIDADRPSAQVPGWDAAARNNDRLTAEQYMDRQFTAKGIPLELRKDLLGGPAPGSLAARGLKTFVERSTGYQVSFTYPAAWQLADPSQSNALANGVGTSLTDSTGKEVARLALGDTNEWTGCQNEAPYRVIDSQPMPGLPFDPAASSQGTPRFAFVAMTAAANDGGPVQAGIGITNRIAGQNGTGCVLDFAVAGPGPLQFYSFSTRRPLGGPTWGIYRFQTLDEATAFTKTQSYKDLKTVITSLTVTKLN